MTRSDPGGAGRGGAAQPTRRPDGRFAPGTSGNPGGRPRGARTLAYSIRQLVAEVLHDPDAAQRAKQTFAENLTVRRTNLAALELAAKLNREIGIGSGDEAPGLVITIKTGLRPERLGRRR